VLNFALYLEGYSLNTSLGLNLALKGLSHEIDLSFDDMNG
jgi:hypothetical protein